MCQPTDKILSDVHVIVQPNSTDNHKDMKLTRFKFSVPTNLLSLLGETDDQLAAPSGKYLSKFESVKTDRDGDLVPTKRRKLQSEEKMYEVITIEHRMETVIQDVGFQVWMGSLLLCDFVVAHQSLFKGHLVLEFGGGMGLCSIVTAFCGACKVFCTDKGNSILTACQKNIERNHHLWHAPSSSSNSQISERVVVKELDWRRKDFDLDATHRYSWNKKEIETVKNVDILLAADLIYDDPLTDDLFACILWMLEIGKPKMLYVALEKRYNFTMDQMDVTCKAYQHFLQWVETLQTLYEYSCKQIKSDFPQHFEYDRTEQLELWCISKP